MIRKANTSRCGTIDQTVLKTTRRRARVICLVASGGGARQA
jgi:hypothetical protein